MPCVGGEFVGQTGRLADRHAPQTLRQFLERRPTGQHRRNEPVLRSGHLSVAHPRQQPGPHDARLAGAGSADDQDEPSTLVITRQSGEDFVDEVAASEEVGGVRLVEGAQPLVRVRRGGDTGLPAGEGGDQHRHELRHRGTASRRSAARQDVGDGNRDACQPPVPGPAGSETFADKHGEVVHILAARLVRARRAEHEVSQARLTRVVEQHALRDDPTVHDLTVGRGDQCAADANRPAPPPRRWSTGRDAGGRGEYRHTSGA